MVNMVDIAAVLFHLGNFSGNFPLNGRSIASGRHIGIDISDKANSVSKRLFINTNIVSGARLKRMYGVNADFNQRGYKFGNIPVGMPEEKQTMFLAEITELPQIGRGPLPEISRRKQEAVLVAHVRKKEQSVGLYAILNAKFQHSDGKFRINRNHLLDKFRLGRHRVQAVLESHRIMQHEPERLNGLNCYECPPRAEFFDSLKAVAESKTLTARLKLRPKLFPVFSVPYRRLNHYRRLELFLRYLHDRAILVTTHNVMGGILKYLNRLLKRAVEDAEKVFQPVQTEIFAQIGVFGQSFLLPAFNGLRPVERINHWNPVGFPMTDGRTNSFLGSHE